MSLIQLAAIILPLGLFGWLAYEFWRAPLRPDYPLDGRPDARPLGPSIPPATDTRLGLGGSSGQDEPMVWARRRDPATGKMTTKYWPREATREFPSPLARPPVGALPCAAVSARQLVAVLNRSPALDDEAPYGRGPQSEFLDWLHADKAVRERDEACGDTDWIESMSDVGVRMVQFNAGNRRAARDETVT